MEIEKGSSKARGAASATVFSSLAAIGALVALVAFFASDVPAWKWMYDAWMNRPDDSHGVLVPAFSAWLLWHRRGLLSELAIRRGSWLPMSIGILLITIGVAARCAGIYSRVISLEAVSILPCLAGATIFSLGWVGVKWSWSAIAFLVFMIPIPNSIGGLLGHSLQSVATECSTYILQTMGIPAVSEGNVIWLTEKSLGVAEACSGIRMLTSFFALAVGACLVIEQPVWEKFLIVLSAPGIAIVSNVLRIVATALAYEFGNEKMAEMIFHDLAGWLMMPAGLALLWVEMFLISRVFEKVDRQVYGFGALNS